MSDGPEGLDFFVLHDVAIIEKIVILGGRGQAIVQGMIASLMPLMDPRIMPK